jgi:hypothetical protein
LPAAFLKRPVLGALANPLKQVQWALSHLWACQITRSEKRVETLFLILTAKKIAVCCFLQALAVQDRRASG